MLSSLTRYQELCALPVMSTVEGMNLLKRPYCSEDQKENLKAARKLNRYYGEMMKEIKKFMYLRILSPKMENMKMNRAIKLQMD